MRILINVAVIAAILFLSLSLYQMRSKSAGLMSELASLQAQVGALEDESSELDKNLEYYLYPENIEKEVRARLNAKYPDEELIIVAPQNRDKTVTEGARDATKENPVPGWKNFLRAIKL